MMLFYKGAYDSIKLLNEVTVEEELGLPKARK